MSSLIAKPVPIFRNPILHEGIVAGEIIAWRAWRIVHGITLYSMAMPRQWLPDVPMTGDVDDDYGVEGVYSFKTQHHATAYADNGCVVGRVKIWGEIVEYELGYRSENAKIFSLDIIAGPSFMFDGKKRMLRILREIYNVKEHGR